METQTQEVNEFFDVRTVNDWIAEAKPKPVPKMLFGELCLEGELAILFADTGKGKSLLAVQIAESIARGRSIEPFEMNAKPKNVLYLDFELSEKQLEMRYAADHDAEKSEYLNHHHKFSNRFQRVEVRTEALFSGDTKAFNVQLRRLIEPLVRESHARVLIIDNITYLKRTAESTRESTPLMKELQRLKRELGISILVIAHTPKRDTRRPIAVNDLQGSKVIANFADNIFAIGQSKLDVSQRYIKHIKPRSTELIYSSAHVPTFRILKLGRKFLGFEFCGFRPESEHLKEARVTHELETIERIKQMSDEGISIRKIADELQRPKSTIHRLLKMWQPEVSEPPVVTGTSGETESSENSDPNYFPGKEEYDEANADPRFADSRDRTDLDSCFLDREHYLIQLARADARKAYQKTGVAPRLDEHEKYRDFKEAVRVYHETGVVQDPIAFMFPMESELEESGSESSPPYKGGVRVLAAQNRERGVQPGGGSQVSDSETGEPPRHPKRMPPLICKEGSREDIPLTISLDSYGREILVEEFQSDGKPRIWYRIDLKGVKRRYERNGFTVTSLLVNNGEEVPNGICYRARLE